MIFVSSLVHHSVGCEIFVSLYKGVDITRATRRPKASIPTTACSSLVSLLILHFPDFIKTNKGT